jgi:hypothetical protein
MLDVCTGIFLGKCQNLNFPNPAAITLGTGLAVGAVKKSIQRGQKK